MLKFLSLACATLVSISPSLAETPVATDEMTKAQARERLSACGTEWQKMKRSGSEGSLIWREFSKTCMARKSQDATQSIPKTKPPRNENASQAR
jgi:hypothetical protein